MQGLNHTREWKLPQAQRQLLPDQCMRPDYDLRVVARDYSSHHQFLAQMNEMAQRGNSKSMIQLAQLNHHFGREEDTLFWLKRAAQVGNRDAALALAVIHSQVEGPLNFLTFKEHTNLGSIQHGRNWYKHHSQLPSLPPVQSALATQIIVQHPFLQPRSCL